MFEFQNALQFFEGFLRSFESETAVGAIVHEFQFLIGDVDGVNEIFVHDQAFAHANEEVLLQHAEDFGEVVQLKRHGHGFAVEEMHVAVVAGGLDVGNIVGGHAEKSDGGGDFESFHSVIGLGGGGYLSTCRKLFIFTQGKSGKEGQSARASRRLGVRMVHLCGESVLDAFWTYL